MSNHSVPITTPAQSSAAAAACAPPGAPALTSPRRPHHAAPMLSALALSFAQLGDPRLPRGPRVLAKSLTVTLLRVLKLFAQVPGAAMAAHLIRRKRELSHAA